MKIIKMLYIKIFRYKLISIFFIISQLVMFYAVFGALSIYNRAYAKEMDKIKSLYDNRYEISVTTSHSKDMFKYIAEEVNEGNLLLNGKLSLAYTQAGANTRSEVILKVNEDLPYEMVSGRLPGSEPEDYGKNLIAVGRYKYKDAYELDGKKYVTIENEEYEICGVIGCKNSDYYDYKMVFNINCLGERTLKAIYETGNYVIELSSNQFDLKDSYSAVYGNIKSVDEKAQISAKKINSTGESAIDRAFETENMKVNEIIYIFCIFNCLLMSQFWLIQRKKEIAVKKICGTNNVRILGSIMANMAALSLIALVIFLLSVPVINIFSPTETIITVNLFSLCTTIAAIVITLVLSLVYPMVKLLNFDTMAVIGSDE